MRAPSIKVLYLGMVLFLALPCFVIAAEGYERPDWTARGRAVWGGNLHEPLAFYRRENRVMAGVEAQGLWLEDWYSLVRSPETIRELARLGANVLYVNFAKGAGGDPEYEDLRAARRVVELCRAEGIRTLAYIQFASKHAEEFYQRYPRARQWRQQDPAGRPRTYGDRYYREIMCPSDTGYVGYLRTILRSAVEDFGFDGVFLDNCYYDGCWCEDCQRSFRAYLERNIRDPLESLGINNLDGVRLPVVNSQENTVTDRLQQEWLRWRVNLVPDVLDTLRAFVKETAPGAAFTGNTIYPRMNNWHLRGVNPQRIMRIFDMPYIEGHNFPRWERGIAVNNAPAMLMAVEAGTNAIPGVWLPGTVLPGSGAQIELALGESLAWGGHTLAGIWALRMKGRSFARSAGELAEPYFTRPEIHDPWERYSRFLHENSGLYTGSRPVAPVAVYHSEHSMAFDWATAYPSFVNTTQGLVCANLPFGILFSRDLLAGGLEALRGRRLLLVCSQRCLDGSEAALMEAFARQGGTLVLTGESGLYDRDRRERPDYPFTGITGASLFDRPGRGIYSEPVGQGRVVFLPEAPELSEVRLSGGTVERTVPGDFYRVVEEVETALEGSLPARVERAAPGVASMLFRTSDGRLALHLLNYRNTEPAGDILLRVGEELAGRQAKILGPEGETARLRKRSDGRLVVEDLRTYGCVVWE